MALAEYWLEQQHSLGAFIEPGVYLGMELGELFPRQRQQTLRELFEIDHVIFIINRYKHYVDIFMLGAHPEHRHIIHTYLTHIGTIKQFLQYYLERCDKLIKLAVRQKIMIPNTSSSLNLLDKRINKATALPAFKPKHYFINEAIGFVSLTRRQKICLAGLIQGKSAKQIAASINISSRTVETYIKHIKSKFKCSKVSQLS